MCVYIYIFTCVCVYIYIYIYFIDCDLEPFFFFFNNAQKLLATLNIDEKQMFKILYILRTLVSFFIVWVWTEIEFCLVKYSDVWRQKELMWFWKDSSW